MMKDVNKHEASLVDEHGELYQESRYDMSRNSGLLRQYICGGRGIVTLENINTKIHHTYEFRRPNNPEEFDDHILFVYTLVRDNTWMYVGMYRTDYYVFRLTRASRFRSDSEIVRGVKYLVRRSNSDKSITDSPMRIYHEGICAICGRKLTTPKSIMLGMGPQCRRALKAAV